MSDAIQDFYPDDFAWCYGCGRLNEAGYRIKTRLADGETVTVFTPSEHHTALPGLVYGGLLASTVDCHSTGSAAIFALMEEGRAVGDGPAPRFVTAHLDLDFVRPTPLRPFRVTGRMVEIGPRKVVVASEVDSDDEVTVRSRAVLVKVPEGFASGHIT